jgi:lysophospholipase II
MCYCRSIDDIDQGLGQTNLTWKMVVAEALAPELPNVQWILPHAYVTLQTLENIGLICPRPSRSVSLNQGRRRPSWFDIARLPPGPNEFDEHGLLESVALIENLILSQVHAGIDSRRIVLVGFSQGAALSMTVALTTLYFLGGVVSLSGWIPPPARHVSVYIVF